MLPPDGRVAEQSTVTPPSTPAPPEEPEEPEELVEFELPEEREEALVGWELDAVVPEDDPGAPPEPPDCDPEPESAPEVDADPEVPAPENSLDDEHAVRATTAALRNRRGRARMTGTRYLGPRSRRHL
jgi:hypothetical protein